MDTRETYAALRTAIMEGNQDEAVAIARQVVDDGADLMGAIEAATGVIREVGDRFGEGECFLPELVMAAEAMQGFMGVLTPELEKSDAQAHARGKAVVGTVQGDIHSIGKSIVATMLKASGYEVLDLGVNVAPMTLIDAAEKAGAKVIGLSALMTTSMPYQKEVISLLKELGARDKFWVVLGGGPVTSQYAESVGADGWAADAAAAVRLVDRMLISGSKPAASGFAQEGK